MLETRNLSTTSIAEREEGALNCAKADERKRGRHKRKTRTELVVFVHSLLLSDLEAFSLLWEQILVVRSGCHGCGVNQ
jgi:hypothetical protein